MLSDKSLFRQKKIQDKKSLNHRKHKKKDKQEKNMIEYYIIIWYNINMKKKIKKNLISKKTKTSFWLNFSLYNQKIIHEKNRT